MLVNMCQRTHRASASGCSGYGASYINLIVSGQLNNGIGLIRASGRISDNGMTSQLG